MWHESRRVIAYLNNEKLIFDSINRACEYFQELGHQLLPTQLKRIIEKNGVWCYQDQNGNYVDVIFDELFE